METINEKIIKQANKLIELAQSDSHLTDKGCVLHFIADELKEIGKIAIDTHQKEISKHSGHNAFDRENQTW